MPQAENPDAVGNTLGDNGVLIYDAHGKVVRESFGRPLTLMERVLCDALDKRRMLRYVEEKDLLPCLSAK